MAGTGEHMKQLAYHGHPASAMPVGAGTPDMVNGNHDAQKAEEEGLELKGEVYNDTAAVRDWTDAEEAKVKRKLDMCVIFVLAIGFFMFQLERGVSSQANAGGLRPGTKISLSQFNTGQTLYYLGLIIFEIPSNIVLHRLGPSTWMSAQVLAFGSIATLTNLSTNYKSWYAFRFLLGLTECGFVPGALYTLSTFYMRSELGKRNSCLFLGTGLAAAVAGLLASGILGLAGVGGIAGWRWLFIIEGLMGVVTGFILLAFLPRSVHRPHPRIDILFPKVRYFSDKEVHIISQRMANDDSTQAAARRGVSLREVWNALSNWRIIPHLLLPLTSGQTTSAYFQYAPSLIRGFGFSPRRATALSSVSGWINMPIMIIIGFGSDKLKSRGPWVIAGYTLYAITWVPFAAIKTGKGRWAKFTMLTFIGGFNHVAHPLNAAWLGMNQATPQIRVVVLGAYMMATNLSNMIGSQIMVESDAPEYHTAFWVCTGLSWAAAVFALLQHLQYRYSNRYILSKRDTESDDTWWDRKGYAKAFKYTE